MLVAPTLNAIKSAQQQQPNPNKYAARYIVLIINAE